VSQTNPGVGREQPGRVVVRSLAAAGPGGPGHALTQSWSLPRGVVHVWSSSLEVPPEHFEQYIETLSPDELVRAGRFRFERHRRQYIAGRGLLRHVLARYLALDPRRLHFRYGPHGKPALDDPAEARWLRFNVSNSEEAALIAVGRERELGVDLEVVRPVADIRAIAAHYFCPRERALLSIAPRERQHQLFFKYWTRKEAVLKATGDGLALPLDQIDVSGMPRATPRLLLVPDGSGVSRRLCWLDLPLPAGYAGALAIEHAS
jgi:4'-phosphopantetheinyl transferase